MTPVEQALSASLRHMTISEISVATMLGFDSVRHELHGMAAGGRIDCIPAHGQRAARYALKSTTAGAMPADQPEVSNNTGSDGLVSLPEAVAVAIENPEPDAALPPSADGSGGDVWLAPEMQYLAPEDYELPPADPALLASANRALAKQLVALRAETDRLQKVEIECNGWMEMVGELQAELNQARQVSGYIVIAAKRKQVRFTKIENARAAAMSAIHAGAQRADVFALVPVGVARKGAEWRDA